MDSPTARHYRAQTQTTNTFGRVLCGIRDQHFIVDGPVQNGCPGEAPTPGELILAAAAACGTELIQVLARDQQLALSAVHVGIEGMVDREDQPRKDVTTFNRVKIHVALSGVSAAEGEALVNTYRQRCPVYGSLAVASAKIDVTHAVS